MVLLRRIEVVDLVWKGLRHVLCTFPIKLQFIEVVDLVWKGLRHVRRMLGVDEGVQLKSLTWFGRDCDQSVMEASAAACPD